MEHVARHPVEHAEKFERSLKIYVNKLQEDGPAKNLLVQRQDLSVAKMTLDDNLRTGTKRSKRWIFVEKEYWDETKRGPLPKDKLVQQTVDGEKKWGIICDDEPKGHHRFESFEARECVESDRLFDSSQGLFAEEALQRARETYSQGQQREQRLREQQAVSDVPKAALPTAEQVDQLTEMIRSLGSRSIGNVGAIDLKDDATTEEWAAPAHGGEELGAEDSEGSLASSQGGDRERLDMVWDRRRTRLLMAGCCVEKQGAIKAPTRKRPYAAGHEPPLKRAGTAAHSETANADYDIRIRKALTQYNEALHEAQESLDKISFNEGLKTSKGDILASCNSRAKEIASISRDIKALEAKIRRAKGQPFQEPRRLFLELKRRCGVFSTFNQPRP